MDTFGGGGGDQVYTPLGGYITPIVDELKIPLHRATPSPEHYCLEPPSCCFGGVWVGVNHSAVRGEGVGSSQYCAEELTVLGFPLLGFEKKYSRVR